ncbi:MAG TPA: FAD-dependent oxidoreductase [Negativicutes bacterium]|nr:FAD-dependent oxidoreductase [Negativicutes bacterium]
MNVGVVGGGINGLCCAWILAQSGHQVTLFERNRIMDATSRSSSKLLHGGIRYLENGELRLVREALRERDAWLAIMPDLAKPLPIIYPKYRWGKRQRWMLEMGFGLYGLLSGASTLPPAKWLDPNAVMEKIPDLRSSGLEGGFLYYDVQMDDYELGKWVASQCLGLGVKIREYTPVMSVAVDGTLKLVDGSSQMFERLLNVAGPWAENLLTNSDITPRYQLDLVRGSHLIINRDCLHSLILEVPHETRIFFVLPWQGKTLVGTTEVRQTLDDAIICSDQERQYLLEAYNCYFTTPISNHEVIETFAGLRPLLRSADNPGRASREYAIQRNENLTTVFGGKWTTARALAYKVQHKCLAR